MEPAAEPITVVIEDEDNSTRVDPVTGDVEVDQPDGAVVVRLNPPKAAEITTPQDFYRNLAGEIADLDGIAQRLSEQIEADDQSRAGYLSNIAKGLDMLGLKLAEPRSDVADSTSPMDGMSSVTNPLLLEACLKGWANSQAELLPAEGPCKVQNVGDANQQVDDLGDVLEQDMNWYLTSGAPEYYPDTSSMLLWGVYFGGCGIKKVYRCPLRRRPVSDWVDNKDLIVSDTTKDLRACERITHQTLMRPSVLQRMILAGEYRDQPPPTPPTATLGVVENKIAGIQGTSPTFNQRPEDQPYTIWEVQCELLLEQYATGNFIGKQIPLPFRVTMEKDSKTIFAIRRDWEPDDDDCKRKQLYVKYPYVPGPGFYGTGLLHILGNCSQAMTAAWREALDAGMFANFPGGLIAKLGTRQNTNENRVAPGSFKPVETNGLPIDKVAMPLPYKDVTAGLLALIDKITAQAKEVGGTADIPAGEGLQNIPVGTMLANIEQATKIMSAAHKGMHQAQGEELELLVELFRENPEDFWRGNKSPAHQWNEQNLLEALQTFTLVPRSDPNVPSHIHRVMKAIALLNLLAIPQFTQQLDPTEVLKRCLNAIREDPKGLLVQPVPQQAPPDLAGQAKMLDAQTKAKKAADDAQNDQLDNQIHMAALASQERIANTKLATETIIHSKDMQQSEREHNLNVAQASHDAQMDVADRVANQQTPPIPGS